MIFDTGVERPQGLTIAELNQIAKDHGSNLTGFNAAGELASGLNKQAFENTRKGIKTTLREKTESVTDSATRAQSEALDAAMSDIYKVQPLVDKMTEMVARNRQRTAKPTVARRLKELGIKAADVATLGSVSRAFPRAMEGMRINNSINFLEAEEMLQKQLQQLQKIETIKDDTKYADALADYMKNIPVGMSIRSTVTPLKVGQAMTEAEFDTVVKYIDNIQDGKMDPEFNAFLDKNGLSKAEPDELNRFLKEATDQFERPETSFNQSATTKTTLLEEAKPGATVYHGTPNTFEGKPNFPFYLTTDPEYASVYKTSSASSLGTGRKAGNAGVMEYKINPDARILDLRTPEGKKALEEYWSTMSMSGEQVKTKSGLPDWTEGENIAEFVDENNLPFDAVLLDEGGTPSFDGTKSRGIAFQALNDKAITQK